MSRRRRRHVKRFAPPGTAPGTLLAPIPEAAGPAHLSLVVFHRDGATQQSVASVGAALSQLRAGGSGWLAITSHQTGTLEELQTSLGVHPLVLEDVLNVGQRPKVEQFDNYLFVVVDLVRPGVNGESEEEQVSLLLFDRLLVSIQERDSDLFRPVLERLLQGRGAMRSQGVDYLAYALIDAMVDSYFPLLDGLGEEMDALEDTLLERPDRTAFERLHALKRTLLRVRRATWPLREAVGVLARAETPLVRDGTRLFLRDVRDHTVQIMDIVETYRDTTAELADLYVSSMSHKLNETIKVLTIIATIFMPLSFLAGVYGMNFDPAAGPWNMPELGWRWGYAAFWVTILTAAAGMLWWFKRNGWF